MLFCVQHSETVKPGNLAAWAHERGVGLQVVHPYAGEPLPRAADVTDMVILGGAMNVDHEDEHPWLADEKALLRRLVRRRDMRLLGICLGSQLLAEALGARVYCSDQHEIGWWPVRLTDDGRASTTFGALPPELTTFHWHGCTFDIPAGATRVAHSDGCANQAFEYEGRVFGVQFHPEFSLELVHELVAADSEPVPHGSFVQAPHDFLGRVAQFSRARGYLDALLDRVFARLLPTAAAGGVSAVSGRAPAGGR